MASDGNDNDLRALTVEIAGLNARIQEQHERLMELQAFNGRQSQFLIWLAGLAVVLLFVIASRIGTDQGSEQASAYPALVAGSSSPGNNAGMGQSQTGFTGSSGTPVQTTGIVIENGQPVQGQQLGQQQLAPGQQKGGRGQGRQQNGSRQMGQGGQQQMGQGGQQQMGPSGQNGR